MKLKNKVALITGGGSGIGRATATLFAQEGANVVIADKNPIAGQAVVEELRLQQSCLFIETDVRFGNQVKKLIETTIREFGQIDVLFNNAGVEIRALLQDTTEEDWDKVLDTNIKGSFLCSKFTIPYMVEAGGGVIIFNSSLMANLALPGATAYCASKAALVGLTKSLALELATYQVRVNVILPGSIDTPHMWIGIKPDKLDEIKKESNASVPWGRIGYAEEVAKAVLYLSSDDASYITGAELRIDGGLGAKIATIQ